MRAIFVLCAVLLLIGGVLLWRSLREPTHFGVFVGAPKTEISEVIGHPEVFLHRTVAIEGVIVDQCTTMGCYFFFRAGAQQLRVDLSEIAMRAPKGRNGRRARVEGRTVPYDRGYQFWASAVEFE